MTDRRAQPFGSVAAVLPTYNRKGLLVRCLRSLLRQTYPLTKVYIIDNASTDGTREYLREEKLLDDPRLCYLRLTENAGPAGAHHAGIGRAVADGADWVWLLDDDSEAGETTLERLITAGQAADPDTVAVCPAIADESGVIWTVARGHFRRRTHRWRADTSLTFVPLADGAYAGAPRKVDWAYGLGLLVRSSAIRRVGLPEHRFFFGQPDIEYTLRLSRAGALWLIPSAVITDTAQRPGRAPIRRRQLGRVARIPQQIVPIESYWRRLLAYRNNTWTMKRYGKESLLRFLVRLLVTVTIIAVCDDRPLLRVRWLIALSLEGWLGHFRRLTPERWRDIIGYRGAK
jgi:GT2 family glycosyltransferase